MAAAHRSLARLPLYIFSNIKHKNNDDDNCDDPKALKTYVTSTLKNDAKTSTVGDFLELSPMVMMRILDTGLKKSKSSNYLSLSLTYRECQMLIRRVCCYCGVVPQSALEFLQQTTSTTAILHEQQRLQLQEFIPQIIRHVSTGMDRLDEYLKGGLRVGTITEVVGRAGVGKTQLAMQLCCELGGRYRQGSVFIDTEQKISLRRFQEIASLRHQNSLQNNQSSPNPKADEGYFNYDEGDVNSVIDTENNATHDSTVMLTNNEGICFSDPKAIMNNVTISNPKTMKQLLETLSSVELDILQRNELASKSDAKDCFPVRLVVIDSIAAPLRHEIDSTANSIGNKTPVKAKRLSTLFHASQILKRMAHQLQIAVLVVNQVDYIGHSRFGDDAINNYRKRDEALGADFVAVTSALGPTWQHCPSTRIFLEHERDPHRQQTNIDTSLQNENIVHTAGESACNEIWMNARGHVRTATVIKSNVANVTCMKYEIIASGVSQLNL